VATQDWLANELAEHGERYRDAAYRDRIVLHLMTAAGASAPADAVFFTANEAMQTSRARPPCVGRGRRRGYQRSEEYSDDPLLGAN